MGCGSSKVDDLPLVTLCRERRDLIRAASDRRYALAAAHLSYFQSLRDIGDALRRFSDEELVLLAASAAESSSIPGSPALTLPSDEGKPKKSPSSSASISHSHLNSPEDEGIEDSHLHFSSGSGSDSEQGSDSGHIRIEDSPQRQDYYPNPYPPPTPSYYNGGDWGSPITAEVNSSSFMYYAKRAETPIQSMVYEEPETERYSYGGFSGYSQYNDGGGGGFFGFSMGSPQQNERRDLPDPRPQAPPSPPKVSAWDYLNFFDAYDNADGHSYPGMRYGYGSNTSSPDSNEVREREGIPDLEDETDPEALKVKARKKVSDYQDAAKRSVNSGEGTSRSVPKQKQSGGEESSRAVLMKRTESPDSGQETEIKSSSVSTIDTVDSSVMKSPVEESSRKKAVSFEIDEAPNLEVGSSKQGGLATLTVHRTRDLQEVVKEIRDEFETASSYGREVAVLLEVGNLPYQPRAAVLKVVFSRILYLIAPSMLSAHPPPRPSLQLSSRTLKMAKEYSGGSGKDSKLKPLNLSSTLEKLYAWEKKLHKEVKDEERLRIIYEKKCRRLKYLDEHGAEPSKIDATQASVRKLLTKINVCIKAVDTIATRIHKLRDEELLPQITELIHGLIRMWKFMLKCHQKQFRAIMESKLRKLKVNGGFRRDTGLKATIELEMELLNWCTCFNKWINTQKSYVKSLHEWLSRCILHEQEETDDGVAPFSPSRIGAPPIFVICNDWFQAMDRISEKGVSSAMSDFAAALHQLWERQDEEQRHKIKAEYLSKDFEKRLRQLRAERGKLEKDHDASSDKTALSRVPSGSGISPLDDLKVDLDSMRKKLAEERARHKEAIKLVHDAASNSLQTGLTPIFEALGNFTSEALKAHEDVRLPNSGGAK